MTYLVGDIGGTNTRLALADETGLIGDSVTRARNDDFESFDAILASFLKDRAPGPLAGVCVAIAGPVSAGSGRLTNRDWSLCAETLQTQSGAQRAELINDLSALGYALGRIEPEHVCGTAPASTNGQSLVVGMGTGFNVSPVRRGYKDRMVAMEAELGHAELPYSVGKLLRDELGKGADVFKTFEDCFCGRGLERLHFVVSGDKLGGYDIVSRYASGDAQATHTVRLFARALGRLTRAMIHLYMPRTAIAFAGSASRGVLTSDALEDFKTALLEPGVGIVDAGTIPIKLITDDAAALEGCLQFLVQAS